MVLLRKVFYSFCFIFLHQYHLSRAEPLIGRNVETVRLGEYQFVVSFGSIKSKRKSSTGINHFCGGTLITRKHVLTAAHCFSNISFCDIEVSVGHVNLRDGRIYSIKKIETFKQRAFGIHDDFTSVSDDIAVVELSKNVHKNIKLAVLTNGKNEDFYKKKAITVGWGNVGSNITPKWMRYATVDIINLEDCTKKLRTTIGFDEYGYINETYICTHTYPYAFLGAGDSGGPLFVNGNELIAVNKAVIPDDAISPNVKLRDIINIHVGIQYYKDFIEDVINDEPVVSCIGCKIRSKY